MEDFVNISLEGNDIIEAAIAECYRDSAEDNLQAVLAAVRQRMIEEGHFLFPVFMSEDTEGEFTFATVQDSEGVSWNAAFTSQEEYEKGQKTQILSFFIDRAFQFCMESGIEGFVINPWGQSFKLDREIIGQLLESVSDTEYSIPDVEVTEELLEDGSFLKKAAAICNSNPTWLNLVKLCRILRDSIVWIPCTAILSEADNREWSKLIEEAEEQGGLDSAVGMTLSNRDQIRLIPDILQSGDDFFFPVFSSEEEMGEYGDGFSKLPSRLIDALDLARNNDKKVAGIVINAFTEPFVVARDQFELIESMQSSIGGKENI